MHIVFCCDRQVLPGLHVAAYSLLDRFDVSQSSPQITIFSDALDESDIALLRQTLETLGKPFSLSLHPIDISRFAHFPPLNGSWATYYRLYAFEVLDADRLLYVDADTLCDVDVSQLQHLNMGSHPAAWVPEAPLNSAIDQGVSEQLGGSKTDSYFNAGVMLINVPEWRKQNISQRAMRYISTYRPKFHDQSALNVLLHRNATTLDPKFNCISNVRTNWPYIKHSYGNIDRLVHFVDYPKPWSLIAEFLHPQYELWQSVLNKTRLRYFRSWHNTSARRLSASRKAWRRYQKSAKDRLLFVGYQQNWIKSVKGI